MSAKWCPVCALEGATVQRVRAGYVVECPRCGRFHLDDLATLVFDEDLGDAKRGLLSHLIRRMQREGEPPPYFDVDRVRSLIDERNPPTPAEQVENLIQWLGHNLPAPGELADLRAETHRAIVGATTDGNFLWLLSHMINRGLLDGSLDSAGTFATLSFEGWELFAELERGERRLRQAFMALKFGEELMDAVFTAFKVAVKEVGFDLIRLDEAPRAGLIDDRLRVELRRSRFLIADLTHGNKGAYWEAGFAEGLGRPVIYSCEDAVFDAEGTHFDTNHHLTVKWSRADLVTAAKNLKATIRATLPEEAIMSDPAISR